MINVDHGLSMPTKKKNLTATANTEYTYMYIINMNKVKLYLSCIT